MNNKDMARMQAWKLMKDLSSQDLNAVMNIYDIASGLT